MKLFEILLLNTACIVSFGRSMTLGNDADVVKQRIVSSLLPTDEMEGKRAATDASHYVDSLTTNYSWSDIDYKDETRGAWKAPEHLSRLKVMSRAFRSSYSPLQNNSKLASAIHGALGFWLMNDFKNPNWWYNEIGVPLDIANIYLVFENQLTMNESKKGVEIMERATWWKGWTGANLVWMCNIQIQRGLLTNNKTAVDQCFDRIYKEIAVVHQQQDGIQTDGSFHQHGPELLAGSYGSVFTSQVLLYISYSQGTKYFMSNETLSAFSHLVLDGQQWMIYGGTWDWSVIGRGCSSPRGDGFPFSPSQLQQVPGPRHEEYVSFGKRIIDRFQPQLIGNFYYWDSDYMVHRRPGYMVSLHMHSNRTVASRCVNSQGIKSEHFADGVVNLYYTGREYNDIFPVWDWQRLPGITCEQHIPLLPCNYDFKVKSSNFVGGVSNSEHGAAAMHLMSHNLSSLNSWFFFGDVYVAIGTNISCTSGNPVYTSLANRLLDGNVTVRVAGVAAPITLKEGNYKYSLGDSIAKDRLLWVHHGNTGYFPLRSDGHGLGGNVEFLLSTMYVNNMPRTGDWSSIGTSHGNITRDVFDMYIDHGLSPSTTQSFAYAVVPLTDVSPMDTLLHSNLNIKLLSNTPNIQAIFHIKEMVLAAVVWDMHGGKVDGGEGWQIEINYPVLLIVSEEGGGSQGKLKLSVSSPVYPPREGIRLQIDRNVKCGEPASSHVFGGSGVSTSVNVVLPMGDEWGKTVTVECSMM